MRAYRVGSLLCVLLAVLAACGAAKEGISAAASCDSLAETATPVIENDLRALIAEIDNLALTDLDTFTPDDSDAFTAFQVNAQKLDDRSRELECADQSIQIACAAAQSVDRSSRTATIILDALITGC